MKNSFFKEMDYPFIVLVVICIVVSALLGFTNSITAPIIEENARIEAENTRKSVLPEATTFTQLEVTSDMNVESIYADDGGSGYVITAASKGYGGNVVVTIGFSTEGETPGRCDPAELPHRQWPYPTDSCRRASAAGRR